MSNARSLHLRLPLTISVLALLPACGLLRSESNGDDVNRDSGATVYGLDAALPPEPSSCTTIAAPTDCGEFATACGNATPIAAGGSTLLISDLAITSDSIYFLGGGGEATPCPAGFYWVSKGGGDATLALVTKNGVGSIEADDTTLYFVESSSGTETFVAFANGNESVLGTFSAESGEDSGNSLLATAGGVVAYDPEGPTYPSFFLLTPTGLRTIAANVGDGAYLGSAPAFDGNTLFFSWSAPSSVLSAPQTTEDLTLVATTAETKTSRAVGTNATARNDESVAVDETDVYFLVGDPESDDSYHPRPMGVSRVSKSGGPATVIIPPSPSLLLTQLLVDDDNVYVSAQSSDATYFAIMAAPKSGGALRTVWKGLGYPRDVHLDATNLYFWIEAGEGGDIPRPGGFILRVAKNATAP